MTRGSIEHDSPTVEDVEQPTRASSAPDERHDAQGSGLGRYRLGDELGRGGMGRVFRAFDPSLGRDVAIKVLHAEPRRRRASGYARLAREAQALAKLNHPNVVSIYSVEGDGERVFIVMELVEGVTLRRWLDTPRSVRAITQVFAGAARGLLAAHRQGIVHRDFKPSNVLIGPDGRAKITDFGLARSLGSPTQTTSMTATQDEFELDLTGAGNVVGTPAYMAPEQHHGARVDARSDQYAFCVALFEALWRRRPFAGEDLRALCRAKELERPKIPRRSSVPRRLARAILQGLAPDPRRRHDDLQVLIDLLERPDRASHRAPLLAAAGIATASLAALLPSSEPIDRCKAGLEDFGRAWAPSDGLALEETLSRGASSDGRVIASRVAAGFDLYASDWAGRFAAACGREDATGQSLDRTLACLGQAKATFGTTLALIREDLAAALPDDAEAQEQAWTRIVSARDLLEGLPELSECDASNGSTRATPLPDDPGTALRVSVAREELARAEALDRAGHFQDAQVVVDDVLRGAERIGYAPLVVEALAARAELAMARGEHERAATILEGTYFEATECGHDTMAAQAAAQLVQCHSTLGHYDDAWSWASAAEALARRVNDPLQDAMLHEAIGTLLEDEGRYEEALERYDKAHALWVRYRGARHATVAGALNNLGNASAWLGRREDARRHYEAARRLFESLQGPAHPDVAMTLQNLGNLEYESGNGQAAIALFEQARERYARALGDEHPETALADLALGYALLELERPRDALVPIERARVILETSWGEHPLVAKAQGNLAKAHATLGNRREAEALGQAALQAFVRLHGEDHPEVAITWTVLGNVAEAAGDPAAAMRRYGRALEIRKAKLGPNHMLTAHSAFEYATQAWKAGHRAAAVREAELALEVYAETEPQWHAEVERWLERRR